MNTISIQCPFPFPLQLLFGALEREKRILRNTIARTKCHISSLSKTMQVDATALLSGEIAHSGADDMDFIELEGEIALLKHFESELMALESTKVCD